LIEQALERSLDDARLTALARRHAASFASAEPFPHVVIDDFLDPELAQHLAAALPPSSAPGWDRYEDRGRTQKLAMVDEAVMPRPVRATLWALNSGPSIRFLEQLTGITGLVPDPHLVGGGIHRIERGGFLDVHADFNRHHAISLDRRLNLLLYLNPEWDPAWGGDLELWDRSGRCVHKIAPLMNRCVVFATTDDALHGHPLPLDCPPGRARCSLALYYYTNGRPAAERSAPHSTLYVGDAARPAPPARLRAIARRLRGLSAAGGGRGAGAGR
jgi:hypothetical protein